MSIEKSSVTYAVMFNEPRMNGKKLYEPGKVYRFKTKSPSTHIGDVFDSAWEAIHRLFGCIKRGTFEEIPPLSFDPKITSIDNKPMKWAIVRIGEYWTVVDYDNLNDLAVIAEEIINDGALDYDIMNASTIEIEDGTVFRWNAEFAHYCFAKGRISVDTFVKWTFLNENPQDN